MFVCIFISLSTSNTVMDVMAGDPCIYVWDLQIEDEYQRKGIGKHLLTLLSLIGTREKMLHLCLPIQMFDDRSQRWVEGVKGFAPDKSLKKLIKFDSEMEVGWGGLNSAASLSACLSACSLACFLSRHDHAS
jgi:GNAT superfamily N-acetyltransferase